MKKVDDGKSGVWHSFRTPTYTNSVASVRAPTGPPLPTLPTSTRRYLSYHDRDERPSFPVTTEIRPLETPSTGRDSSVSMCNTSGLDSALCTVLGVQLGGFGVCDPLEKVPLVSGLDFAPGAEVPVGGDSTSVDVSAPPRLCERQTQPAGVGVPVVRLVAPVTVTEVGKGPGLRARTPTADVRAPGPRFPRASGTDVLLIHRLNAPRPQIPYLPSPGQGPGGLDRREGRRGAPFAPTFSKVP